MSDGATLRLPVPEPPPPPARRRRRRPLVVALIILLVVAGLLVAADRAAAAYAENRIASQIQAHGFPRKPSVTIEGFPFLTQVISRHLDGVHISSNALRAGPVTVSIEANATGIALNSSYNGGIIGHADGTGLIAFSSLSRLASSAGVPGVKVSAKGPHSVQLSVNLDVVSASAVARITRTGPRKFRIHIVSSGDIPLSVLDPIRTLTVRLPVLPLGLAVHSFGVTSQGIAVRVTGSNIPFGQ